MNGCSKCAPPRAAKTPNHKGSCVQCGRALLPEWVSSDENLATFFDRLGEAAPATVVWLDAFREHAVLRELAGREKFGFQYLTRDNAAEATEEAVDGALYMYLDGLQARREGWDEESDVALTAAYHFAQAHRYSRLLREKRRGNSGPGWDE